ncbi:MAG TPA: universal stress protein [Sphingomonas sp.]|nr:universal stress protein [Sphingomonas sp.]
MKNILVLIHEDTGQEARFQVALDVTRMLNGHLTCLDVVIPPAAMTDDTLGGTVGVILLADEISRETSNRKRIEQRLANEEVSWEWAEATGRIAPSLRNASRFADLIVVNRQLHDFPVPDMRAVAGEVIARSRKPVLAVPEDARRLDTECAMIAWNGSTSAMAAVRQAIPLLARSERVLLVQVDDGTLGSAEAAASYLSRYDIHVRVERVAASPEGVGVTLVEQAVRHHAGYLVAGGFGNMRLAETLFGGVTRELLTNAPCPIFMAH